MTPFYADDWLTIYEGDCRAVLAGLPADSVEIVVTSPPYWMLRDYGHPSQLGMEDTPELYVEAMVSAFRLVRDVMTPTATLWLNLGDTFAASGMGGGGSRGDRKAWRSIAGRNGWRSPPAGYKPKDLTLVPFQLAMALRRDGWYLRQVIVWRKPAAVEPTRLDRPATSHEYIYLLSKSEHYAARDPGLPWWGHSVWDIKTDADSSHQAMMPTELARRCILAGSKIGDTVLDPFSGSGTVARAAQQLNRRSILIDLNPELGGAAQTPLGLGAA
jgi:site-specific DNA-methyltransferase (cytosine-N4-specific)